MTIRLLRAKLAVQHAEELRVAASLFALAKAAPCRSDGSLRSDVHGRLLDLCDDARDRAGRLLARITAIDRGYGVLPVPPIADPPDSSVAGLRDESRRALRSADRYEAAKRLSAKHPNVNQYWTCEVGRSECLDLAYALSAMADRAEHGRAA